MNTSVTSANGMLVITQVIPQNNRQDTNTAATAPFQDSAGSSFFSVQLQTFLKVEPKILGAVQIMIGMINITLGIVLAFHESYSIQIGVPFWPSIMYIISGSISIFAANKMKPFQIKGAKATNIISTVLSCIAIIFYGIDVHRGLFRDSVYHCNINYQTECYFRGVVRRHEEGMKGVLIFFTVLEFWVSLFTSIYSCKAIHGITDMLAVVIQQTIHPSGIPIQIPQNSTSLDTIPILLPPYAEPPMTPSRPSPYTA